MMNRYLQDKAMRRSGRGDRRGRDMRRGMDRHYPQGPHSMYPDSKRGSDYAMDSRNYDSEYRGGDSRGYDMGYQYSDGHYPMERPGERYRPHGFTMHGVAGMYPYPTMDYAHYDGADFAKEEENYKKDLDEWVHKLKKKETRFKWEEHQVIDVAKQMGVTFNEFDEKEFYAIYLAMVTDHPKVANEPRFYISLAKDFFDDDDTARRGSEKVCAYLYHIVLGEDE